MAAVVKLYTLQLLFTTHSTQMKQVVTDKMWAGRSDRFPEETPSTREYYLLRSIFEEHFPSKSALDTVPKVHLPFDASLDVPYYCHVLLRGTASWCWRSTLSNAACVLSAVHISYLCVTLCNVTAYYIM